MVDTVWIPVGDGVRIEVPADDPRAVAYQQQSGVSNSDNVPLSPASRGTVQDPKTPRQSSNGVYTVQPGDSLSAIAQDILGNAGLWPDIARLNQLSNPDHILVGQHLVVPDQTGGGGTRPGSPSGQASAPSSTNVSRSGRSVSAQTSLRIPSRPVSEVSSGASSTGYARLALARGLLFNIFEQLPDVGVGGKIIRKVAVVPRNYAFLPGLPPIRMPGVGSLSPANPAGSLSGAEHVLNLRPQASQYLSASDRAFAAGTIEGTPLLLDVSKIKAAGGRILTVDEVVAQLVEFAVRNPGSRSQIQKLIWTVSKVEGEVLIQGGVPRGAATRITGSAHLGHIRSAESLWQSFKDGALNKAELEQGLINLEKAYGRARVVGRVGRVITVVGVVFTAADLAMATDRSFKQHSARPIGAEIVRQAGGWAGAAAGAEFGGLMGAAFGIETGPGAIITGAVGAMVFGAIGYFDFNWIADHISPR